VAVVAALAALVAWSFAARWAVLNATPEPIGVDGYFYPIELRALLDHGTLQFPTAPLALWWMLPFAAVTDPIVGAKLGAALGGALLAVPAYGLGARLGRGRSAGLVCALLATTSAGSAYLTIEFVKQGIGLTVALAALWCALVAVERRTRGSIVAAGFALLAALLAHKLAAALVTVVVAIAAIDDARARGALRGRRLRYVIAAVIAAAVAMILLGAVAPRRFLTRADLALVADLVSSRAHWLAPALVTPRLTLALDAEALIGGLLALGAAVTLARARLEERSRADRVAAWSFVMLGVTLALPWLAVTDPQGLGFRLRVCAFVPMALCATLWVPLLPARVRWLAPLAALVFVLAMPRDRQAGEVRAHPALVEAATALANHVPPGATVIVGERHVEYMIAWYTRAPVSLRPEAVPYAERVRVVLARSPVHTGFPLEPALDDARREPSVTPPVSLHPGHRDGFVLVTEPTWDWILARLPPDARAYWQAWPTI
jgi:hypothetical protein